jgi:hypothetical protein
MPGAYPEGGALYALGLINAGFGSGRSVEGYLREAPRAAQGEMVQHGMARFWAAVELRGVERGAVGLQPPSRAKLEGGMGGEVVWWMVVVVLTC